MTLISKHILREFITLVLGVLFFILVVYLCVEFLQKADKLIKYHASLSQVTRYFLFNVPSMVTISLPMATLIAALLSLGNLSRHNEIIAMRAGGVGLGKIIAPMLAGGIAISLFGFINNELIMPEYSARANYIRSVEIEKKQQPVMFQQRKLWLRGPDNSIANIELVSPNRTEMLGLNVYKLNADFSVRERITADKLLWENGAWRLKHSRTFAQVGDAVRTYSSDDEVFNIVDSPDDLGMVVKDSEEMSFSEMREYVKRLKTSGYKASTYEVDLFSKIAFPLSSVLMVLISIPFSIHKVRSGGATKGFAFALVIAFFYWTLMSVGQSLGHSGAIPPLVAAWFANIFFSIAAIIVLLRLHRTL
ncbi:MAG: LPS export ABC transporter permease LptG [Betaproteobacteria bacterium]